MTDVHEQFLRIHGLNHDKFNDNELHKQSNKQTNEDCS